MDDTREKLVQADYAKKKQAHATEEVHRSTQALEKIAQNHDRLRDHYLNTVDLLQNCQSLIHMGFVGLKRQSEDDARALLEALPVDREKILKLSSALEEDVDRAKREILESLRDKRQESAEVEKNLRTLEKKRAKKDGDQVKFDELKSQFDECNEDMKQYIEDLETLDKKLEQSSSLLETYSKGYEEVKLQAELPILQGFLDGWLNKFFYHHRKCTRFQLPQRMLQYVPDDSSVDARATGMISPTPTMRSWSVVEGVQEDAQNALAASSEKEDAEAAVDSSKESSACRADTEKDEALETKVSAASVEDPSVSWFESSQWVRKDDPDQAQNVLADTLPIESITEALAIEATKEAVQDVEDQIETSQNDNSLRGGNTTADHVSKGNPAPAPHINWKPHQETKHPYLEVLAGNSSQNDNQGNLPDMDDADEACDTESIPDGNDSQNAETATNASTSSQDAAVTPPKGMRESSEETTNFVQDPSSENKTGSDTSGSLINRICDVADAEKNSSKHVTEGLGLDDAAQAPLETESSDAKEPNVEPDVVAATTVELQKQSDPKGKESRKNGQKKR
jgi:hypothetical protein